jgi:hypothetical protein
MPSLGGIVEGLETWSTRNLVIRAAGGLVVDARFHYETHRHDIERTLRAGT